MPLRVRPDQQFQGPWLDRLFPVILTGGRVCSVVAFHVLPAYSGIMEGGLDAESNALVRERAVALARRMFGEPIHMVAPSAEPLPEISTPSRPRERIPWMACVASLVSGGSRLTLVWWRDAFSEPLPAEIERAAAGVDWEREARGVPDL